MRRVRAETGTLDIKKVLDFRKCDNCSEVYCLLFSGTMNGQEVLGHRAFSNQHDINKELARFLAERDINTEQYLLLLDLVSKSGLPHLQPISSLLCQNHNDDPMCLDGMITLVHEVADQVTS